MSLFEYSKWDGSQDFQPQSADKAFDKLAEYLMQYGDQVLRQLDDIDEDSQEILDKLQEAGYIEEDGEGKFQVAPKGVRRIQEGALTDLFQTFQRDSIGRHDTPQKGGGGGRTEDSKPYVYGDSLADLNLHETMKNAMSRQGGGVPIKLRQDDYVVYETEYPIELRHGRPDRHERVDEPVRQVRDDQEGRARPSGDGPGPVQPGHAPDGRLLLVRQHHDRAAIAQLGGPSA